MTAYATLAELKAQMDLDAITTNDTELTRCLDAAAAWIESPAGCGRVFALDATDTTKLFMPTSEGVVDVPDLVSVTSIKVDTRGDRSYATTLAAADYQLYPLIGSRYEQIRIWPQSSKSFRPDRLVQVVGKFGYVEGAAAPIPIKEANLLLAARLYKRREAPFGILQSTDLGTFTRLSKEDPDVANLLAPYRLSKDWVVV